MMGQTKRFALLIFLACHDSCRPQRREAVLSLFWPDADGGHGRNALRQALHAIREQLGPAVVQGNGTDELWTDCGLLHCDVLAFTEAVSRGLAELALEIYRNDFLVGFSVPGAPGFGAWADQRRSELREMAAGAARDLAHKAEGARDAASALFWWRRFLRHRPYDEEVIRRIVSLLAWAENDGEALAEFEGFRARLLEELGLEPSSATLDLAGKVASGRLEGIVQWVGERRGRQPVVPEPPRRRSGDHTGASHGVLPAEARSR
jgi:DNA-binding SARP family transcriptional activator